MRIALGSDHRGCALKSRLIELLKKLNHEVADLGTQGSESVDYPDYAEAVAKRVASGEADRGILICGTGIGMCIAANKIPGVRAAPCHDAVTAEMSRRHNNLNVLCLSGDLLGEKHADAMVATWLETKFEGGRHARRVDKITHLEDELCEGK